MTNLAAYLDSRAGPELAAAIGELAAAAARISAEIRAPRRVLDAVAGDVNADGDTQKALDVLADEIILGAARQAGAAAYMSEEREAAIPLEPDGPFIIASDPLDGSSNIGVNVSIGTIFSVLPTAGAGLVAGRAQHAAGFFVYGPQTTLLVTVGAGVASFRMDADGNFQMIDDNVRIPEQTGEFAINAGNQRYWLPPVQRYIADCVAGADGPRGRNFSQRYVGSLVAEAWRIFSRGGVFLYPADSRDGFADGRLRLVYEAAPMALLVEQAGGRATDGTRDILDITPTAVHQRVPLVFGSSEEVDEVASQHAAG
ncbi:MAG: class 1 fructose-bisphosphatase [Alphaproteobacteria bacterium]|jgi:fructose-1,6-bisphosphatase I|nr:class 1 fructose-bisphosphatase [Alphaproteobacteria bacterium]